MIVSRFEKTGTVFQKKSMEENSKEDLEKQTTPWQIQNVPTFTENMPYSFENQHFFTNMGQVPQYYVYFI